MRLRSLMADRLTDWLGLAMLILAAGWVGAMTVGWWVR